MPAKRVNPFVIKKHRSYTAGELAARLGVHKNTVRNWQRDGLAQLGRERPALFYGNIVRDFLAARNAQRKRPCPPGTFYCFGCREHRGPALGMVDYLVRLGAAGNLSALCEECGVVMHRRARRAALASVMPGVAIQIREVAPRLSGSLLPSANCDMEREGSA